MERYSAAVTNGRLSPLVLVPLSGRLGCSVPCWNLSDRRARALMVIQANRRFSRPQYHPPNQAPRQPRDQFRPGPRAQERPTTSKVHIRQRVSALVQRLAWQKAVRQSICGTSTLLINILFSSLDWIPRQCTILRLCAASGPPCKSSLYPALTASPLRPHSSLPFA